MSEGGTIKARLEKVTKELDEELELWTSKDITPMKWRMGDKELQFTCELHALAALIQEKLGISQDEMDLRLRELTLNRIREMRPVIFGQIDEARKQLTRQKLVEGIHRQPPPPDIFGPNGGVLN